MRHLARWFLKVSGFLSAIIFFWPKFTYENRLIQGRKITGQAIIISNHRSPLDFVFSILIFFSRSVHCLVSETIFDSSRVLRFFLKCFGSIRVNRFTKDMTFMYEAKKILKQGGVLQVFPEGTFVATDELGPFKSSFIYLAVESGAPIIPVYLEGKYGLFNRSQAVIGSPIDICSYLDQTAPFIEQVTHLTKSLVIKLQN